VQQKLRQILQLINIANFILKIKRGSTILKKGLDSWKNLNSIIINMVAESVHHFYEQI